VEVRLQGMPGIDRAHRSQGMPMFWGYETLLLVLERCCHQEDTNWQYNHQGPSLDLVETRNDVKIRQCNRIRAPIQVKTQVSHLQQTQPNVAMTCALHPFELYRSVRKMKRNVSDNLMHVRTHVSCATRRTFRFFVDGFCG
jgi:hypothetical protein